MWSLPREAGSPWLGIRPFAQTTVALSVRQQAGSDEPPSLAQGRPDGCPRRRVSAGSSLCAGLQQPSAAVAGGPAQGGGAQDRRGNRTRRGQEVELQADVQGPGASGDEFRFPCCRWVEGAGILRLPEGTGRAVLDDPQGLFRQRREHELEERRKLYGSLWQGASVDF
ncbi:polyunsaturated fatty acid lipoxygenase ALOX15-like [Panthera tigris]|uniref:polyunsaturated fatty acid lipoxygenase ALOX15-like n=1 Tax=Panthera tigris TaxID=9694 RepID=UPI001C6FBD5D|nr:polyunsaturated fatty acid lipoxygenase ALOX15-like [Panthera tigris]